MKKYEAVLILNPNLSSKVDEFKTEFNQLLSENSFKVTKLEDIGRRQLAYSINNHNKGHYLLMNLEGDPSKLIEIETKIKYKSLFEEKVSAFQENLENIESNNKIPILALKDIANLKKDALIIINQYRDLISEYPLLSLTEGILLDKKTMGLTKNIENRLFIINEEINEAYFAVQLKVKNDFEIRYHQLRQFLILVILFALFLSFINLFKALRISSE